MYAGPPILREQNADTCFRSWPVQGLSPHVGEFAFAGNSAETSTVAHEKHPTSSSVGNKLGSQRIVHMKWLQAAIDSLKGIKR